jgi:hypothetical protein
MSLKFGALFNQKLPQGVLPENLQKLVLGRDFKRKCKCVVFPKSLNKVIFEKVEIVVEDNLDLVFDSYKTILVNVELELPLNKSNESNKSISANLLKVISFDNVIKYNEVIKK